MKSFPNMVDMARSDADKMADASKGVIMPAMSDLPEYDYGLNISLSKESLAKLDLDDDVHVGDYVHIHAFAKVTRVSQEPGSDKPDCVGLVLTHIAADEDEDDEGSDDEAA